MRRAGRCHGGRVEPRSVLSWHVDRLGAAKRSRRNVPWKPTMACCRPVNHVPEIRGSVASSRLREIQGGYP